MSKFEKLINEIKSLSNDIRFEELKKVLESLGYVATGPKGGSSHYTFRKKGHTPITIPKHETIKTVYIKMIKELIENEEES